MKKIILTMGFFIFALGLQSKAEETAMKGKEPQALSQEQRAKMAELHEKMAACLRSDKPAPECHHEMFKSCSEMSKSGECPMMAGMHHGPKGHHPNHHKSKGQEASGKN